MPTVEETMRTLLYGDATVGGQVGSTSATARIYLGGSVPQNTLYPFIQIEKISDIRTHLVPGGKHVFQTPTVQVSSWDTTWLGAKTLANNIIDAIDGTLDPAMIAGVETDLFDANAQVHQIAVDFKVLTPPLV